MKVKIVTQIGIIVSITLVLFVWGFNYLKGKNMMYKERTFFAVYEKVDGLAEGNPVQINGMKIGYIHKIDLHPDLSGRILVTFLVEKRYNIKKLATAEIISSDLLGAKAIRIIPGQQAAFHESEDTLKAKIELGLTEQLVPMKEKVESMVSSLDSIMKVIKHGLTNAEGNGLAEGFSNVGTTLKHLAHMSALYDSLSITQKGKIKGILDNVQSITTNFKANNEKLNAAIGNFANISDSLAKSNLKSTISKADKTLGQLEAITKRINNGQGSLGLLAKDDSLYIGLKNSSKDLDALLKDIKKEPKKYLKFSVF